MTLKITEGDRALGRDWLPRLTPSSDAEAVDHGGMTVSAHQTVRVQHAVSVEHHTTEILQIHLT